MVFDKSLTKIISLFFYSVSCSFRSSSTRLDHISPGFFRHSSSSSEILSCCLPYLPANTVPFSASHQCARVRLSSVSQQCAGRSSRVGAPPSQSVPATVGVTPAVTVPCSDRQTSAWVRSPAQTSRAEPGRAGTGTGRAERSRSRAGAGTSWSRAGPEPGRARAGAGSGWSRAEPGRAEPDGTEPSRAELEPSRAEPSWSRGRAEPSWSRVKLEPSRAGLEPSRAGSGQVEPSRAGAGSGWSREAVTVVEEEGLFFTLHCNMSRALRGSLISAVTR